MKRRTEVVTQEVCLPTIPDTDAMARFPILQLGCIATIGLIRICIPGLGRMCYMTLRVFQFNILMLSIPFLPLWTLTTFINNYVPTNLDVVLVDSDAVSLRWDDGAADHWEVEVWIDGSEPDSSIVYSTDTNNITLTGLDTSFWYCVKVKAVCDSFNSSDWSDVFRFHVPDYYVRTCPVPENLTVELMDSDWAMVRWNQIEGNASELALCKGDENEWDTISVQEYDFTDVNDLDYDQWYTVKIRAICDSNSVSEWSDTVMFYVPNPDTTGGDDTLSIITTSSPGLLIMPNPTDGITDIISQYKMSKIELFGSNGKCVMSKKADSVNETLDLRSLPSGLYIVRITTVDGVMTKRLVVVGK